MENYVMRRVSALKETQDELDEVKYVEDKARKDITKCVRSRSRSGPRIGSVEGTQIPS